MPTSNISYPEKFQIICSVEPSKPNLQLCMRQDTKLDKVVKKIQENFDCKVYSIYICSSKQLITDYNQKVFDVICRDLVTDVIVNDAMLINISNTISINIDTLYELKEDLLRKDIIRFMVKKMFKSIIIYNEPLSKTFDIIRKKRKDRSAYEVTYTWKENPHVVFRSEKKARLFLMHGA